MESIALAFVQIRHHVACFSGVYQVVDAAFESAEFGMKTTTILVVIGALGLIKRRMEKYISKIPSNILIQKARRV